MSGKRQVPVKRTIDTVRRNLDLRQKHRPENYILNFQILELFKLTNKTNTYDFLRNIE